MIRYKKGNKRVRFCSYIYLKVDMGFEKISLKIFLVGKFTFDVKIQKINIKLIRTGNRKFR